MDQLVIRNRKEYEITLSTDSDFDMDYLTYCVPDAIREPAPDLKYFSKNFLPDGRLIIKMVVYDGTDRFGRHVMKSHSLLFSKDEYRDDYLKTAYLITSLLYLTVT